MRTKLLAISSLVLFIFLSTALPAQVDMVGSGHALRFDGIDDYIELGDRYDDLDYPFTIMAWVYYDPTAFMPGPVFVSQDDDATYNGFWFFATASAFFLETGDGQGQDNPAYRRGKIVYKTMPGHWVHLCIVVNGYDDIQIYMNGQNVGGDIMGESSLPMFSASPTGTARIGRHLSNGVTYMFKGMLDEIKMYDIALTEHEIRSQMCKRIVGNEYGLIGYWNFDEVSGNVLKDSSPNHFDGVLVGNPEHVYSGAPVGDKSIFLYGNSWTGVTLNYPTSTGTISVNDIKGTPYGVHVYEVLQQPSQVGNLDPQALPDHYYGVFVADDVISNSFDVQFPGTCRWDYREDNSVANWTYHPQISLDDKRMRAEFFWHIGPNFDFDFDLGPFQNFCDKPSYTISTGVDPSDKQFLWSTGETTETISVNQSGAYWVRINNECIVKKDTVVLHFSSAAIQCSIDHDNQESCTFEPVLLTASSNQPDVVFTWSDGSQGPTLTTTHFGKYVVTAENFCGAKKDSVSFTKNPAGAIDFDIFEPSTLCDQPNYFLTTGLDPVGKQFLWSTGETTPSIYVSQTGRYSVKVSNPCYSKTDVVTLDFRHTPTVCSIDHEGGIYCKLQPVSLTALSDQSDVTFIWQDGTQGPTLTATEYGTYVVKIENDCGVLTESVTFSKFDLTDKIFPNVITPDSGDDLNQFFELPGLPESPTALKIFNRWGEIVYTDPTYQNNWDGGRLSGGNYYYMATSDCIGEVKGPLAILR